MASSLVVGVSIVKEPTNLNHACLHDFLLSLNLLAELFDLPLRLQDWCPELVALELLIVIAGVMAEVVKACSVLQVFARLIGVLFLSLFDPCDLLIDTEESRLLIRPTNSNHLKRPYIFGLPKLICAVVPLNCVVFLGFPPLVLLGNDLPHVAVYLLVDIGV